MPASRTGASYAVLTLAEIGLIKLVVSQQVLDEVERNLQRKFPDGLPILAEWLTYINPVIVADPEPGDYARWVSLIEEKDAPILEAAVQASVDYFLALNTKHFTLVMADAAGLTIQTPSEFIRTIRSIIVQSI